MTNSLQKFEVYFEHQESPEAYKELVNRIPNEAASIIAPIIAGRLTK